MDNKKKTSLEEAKANYEQIKKFAVEAAKKEFEKEINENVDKMIKESLSIEIDDDGDITVQTDEKIVELKSDGEVEVEDVEKIEDEEIEIEKSDDFFDDNEEINFEKNIEEMITFEQEQTQPVETAPEATQNVAPEVAPEMQAPEASPEVEEAPVEDIEGGVSPEILELAQALEKVINAKVGDTAEEQGVDIDYIDDESTVAPEPVTPEPVAEPTAEPAAPNAQAPVVPVEQEPVQEDELLEFSLDELEEYNDDDIEEFEIPEDDELFEDDEDYFEFDTDDTEAMLTAFGDISRENEDWKDDVSLDSIPTIGDDDEIEESKMMGQGYHVQRTAGTNSGPENAVRNRGRQNNVDNVPYKRLEESTKKIKAQYESKLDELKKENKRLIESNKEFGDVIKNYQESFKDLRKQFDEMQTFNAKLAYANKIFASGGLSTADKAKIAEEFDKVKTSEEAKNLYNRILQENKISINKDNTSKIKAPTTNNVKAKEVVYESAEMKRRKVLAGIEKNEDYI